MLCSRCDQFIANWRRALEQSALDEDGAVKWQQYSELLHANLASLHASSTQGCSICRNAWFTLNEYEQKEFDERTALELEVRPDGGKPILRANFKKPDGSILSRMLAMFFRQDISPHISDIIKHTDVLDRSSTGADSSFKLASFWLTQCLEGHDKCPKPNNFIPTRVLDVQGDPSTRDAKLVETAELNEEDRKRPFVALSHCWGKDHFLITEQHTLDAHKQCIEFGKLPPSFQDAVTTVRNMGLKYLWIDSLCIIQKSAEDWEKESVQMCNVYSQALFTITSAHASGAFGGMFRQRDGIRTMPFEITLTVKPKPVRLTYLPTGQREVSWDTNDLPIYTRAWCFQEMMLSTRNLIFDLTGIRWECVTSAATEGNIEAERGRHVAALRDMQTSLKREKSAGDFFETLSPGKLSMQALVWQSIVRDFAARDLTQATDKLIAIAGVAQEAEARTDNKYLAGLWQRHLYMNLAWYVPHVAGSDGNYRAGDLPFRTSASVAPSWSWASVNRPISYDSFVQQEQFCEVISAETEGTPFKQSGKLTIRGDVRELYVLSPNNPRVLALDKLADEHRYTDHVNISSRLFHPIQSMLATPEPSSFFSRTQIMHAAWYPEDVWDETKPITFLSFMRRPRVEGMGLDLRRQLIDTLALVPTGNRPDEYRRIGLATWHDCSWFGHQCAEDKEAKAAAWKTVGRSFSRLKAPELLDDGNHAHPIAHDPLPAESAYAKNAQMTRRTIQIV